MNISEGRVAFVVMKASVNIHMCNSQDISTLISQHNTMIYETFTISQNRESEYLKFQLTCQITASIKIIFATYKWSTMCTEL